MYIFLVTGIAAKGIFTMVISMIIFSHAFILTKINPRGIEHLLIEAKCKIKSSSEYFLELFTSVTN